MAATAQGRALGDLGASCRPNGLPRMLVTKNYPDEIVQTPGQVTIFVFNMFPIVVWTDGRPHPANLVPSYYGHSTGHWIGETLHVETVGIRGDTPLDGLRSPHSNKLVIRWTVRKVQDDTLHFHVTLYDEEAFTEPVTVTGIWKRKTDPRWQVLDDNTCFENNQSAGRGDKPDGFEVF